jgi:hypothetical protein
MKRKVSKLEQAAINHAESKPSMTATNTFIAGAVFLRAFAHKNRWLNGHDLIAEIDALIGNKHLPEHKFASHQDPQKTFEELFFHIAWPKKRK